MRAAVVETLLRQSCTGERDETCVTRAACHTPMSRPLRPTGGGLGLKKIGLFLFYSLFLHNVLDVLTKISQSPAPFSKTVPVTSHTRPFILGSQPCIQRETDRVVDPWGVVPPVLTPTAQLSLMQFHVPPKESRTAAAARAASACPTATAWTMYSHLRFGEAHAPIGPGALPAAPKCVMVCKIFIIR